MVCVDLIFGRYDVLVVLQQFLWMASTDPIGVSGEYANPVTVWFLEVAYHMGGSRWSESLRRCLSQLQNCFLGHTSGAICSTQVGLQYFHCPFSDEDVDTLVSYSLLERSVFSMSSVQGIIDVQCVQMRGLIKPHKWKCPILSQFHDGCVICVWQFR